MKQLELLNLGPVRELGPVIPFDPKVREELLTLMSTAIVTIHIHTGRRRNKE